MSNGQLAARLNAASLESFTARLSERERRRQFSDPEAFQKFSQRTRENLDQLGPKIATAKKLLDRVNDRYESGEIDLMSLGAEVAAAKMITKLSAALDVLYAKAKDAKDIHAMRRLAVVADRLGVQADELLKETAYPMDATVKKMVIEGKVSNARAVYEDIIRSLDNTHVELGVRIPDFPVTRI